MPCLPPSPDAQINARRARVRECMREARAEKKRTQQFLTFCNAVGLAPSPQSTLNPYRVGAQVILKRRGTRGR
ncbi:MAG TPA: hypothetical protein VHZ74_10660 [Bryobacteraceae bacterium]|jgi:hypothetical protein|nr:hypothetical protein [Bryobacteraceae bacterium]